MTKMLTIFFVFRVKHRGADDWPPQGKEKFSYCRPFLLFCYPSQGRKTTWKGRSVEEKTKKNIWTHKPTPFYFVVAQIFLS